MSEQSFNAKVGAIFVCCVLCLMVLVTAGCGGSKATTKTALKKTADPPARVEPSLATGAAASVNGIAVPVIALDAQVKRIEAQEKTPEQQQAYEADKANIRKQVLDLLVEEELYRQEAAKLKITVTEAEVDTNIAATIARFPSEAEYNQAMADAGMTADDLRAYTRQLVLTNKVNAYVASNNLAPNVEANAYIAANPDQFSGAAGQTVEALDQALRETALGGAWIEKIKKSATIKIFI